MECRVLEELKTLISNNANTLNYFSYLHYLYYRQNNFKIETPILLSRTKSLDRKPSRLKKKKTSMQKPKKDLEFQNIHIKSDLFQPTLTVRKYN